jgi:hypothetical protein
MLVLSNNPQVWNFCQIDCERIEGTPREVLYRALDLVGYGEYSLFAHPIAGNERLLRNPYRTVILTQVSSSSKLCSQDQQTAFINRALDKMENIEYDKIPTGTYDDYATVDFELFKTTMRSTENGELQ